MFSIDQTAVSFITGAEVHCGTGERKLLNNLMTFYQKLERPVANESEAVQLRFGLTLQQIMDVVSKVSVNLFIYSEADVHFAAKPAAKLLPN